LRTGDTDVFSVGTGNLGIGEHLIDMHVHGDTSPRRFSTGHEVIPVAEAPECVVKQYDSVALYVRSIKQARISTISRLNSPVGRIHTGT